MFVVTQSQLFLFFPSMNSSNSYFIFFKIQNEIYQKNNIGYKNIENKKETFKIKKSQCKIFCNKTEFSIPKIYYKSRKVQAILLKNKRKIKKEPKMLKNVFFDFSLIEGLLQLPFLFLFSFPFFLVFVAEMGRLQNKKHPKNPQILKKYVLYQHCPCVSIWILIYFVLFSVFVCMYM